MGIQGTFQLVQYNSPTYPEARPLPGDTVIDAGGCFGETALWFADTVGPEGRVEVLEFSPENLTILHANLARNPRLARRIHLTEAALWGSSDQSLSIHRGGPASKVESGGTNGAPSATPICLDDLTELRRLDRVDFIKMDIEGAEPEALSVACRTLERFTPKLALAAYHNIDHLWQLPLFLDGLVANYRCGLGHFTMHEEETVLYAWTVVDPSGAREG